MTIRKPTLKRQVELLQSTMREAGTPVASGAAHELVAKLNGHASWNVASKAIEPKEPSAPKELKEPEAPVIKGIDNSSLISIFEINMVDVLPPYDDPEDSAAWAWVQRLASFSHVENGTGPGIWEFMVYVNKLPADLAEVPVVLQEAIREGLASKAKWLMFHQG